MKRIIIPLTLLFLSANVHLSAQTGYQPSRENLEARKWFANAKYGLFVHWGVYSMLGDGEWVMTNRNIKAENYRRLQSFFNPLRFDAEGWVRMAKNAGMKYITFTSRHHDGFSNWDTQQSEWKITNTPYGKDVLKTLSDECHKQGVKLFLYYSLLDWYRGDYPHETGSTGKGTGRTKPGDYESYLKFMKAQLTELLTNYGEIAGIWFDGDWDQRDKKAPAAKPPFDWRYNEIYGLIHRLQPQCLIGNNHHLTPFEGEDFQMFERDLPGENKHGFSGQSISTLPLETCATINNTWGFHINDGSHKSAKEIIDLLVRATGSGANLLLNVGPMPDGVIQPEFVARLEEVGNWLKSYGETIYDTSADIINPQDWGVVTRKGNKIFVHILAKKQDTLSLKIPFKIQSAFCFVNNRKVNCKPMKNNEIILDLKDVNTDIPDNVIVLEIKK